MLSGCYVDHLVVSAPSLAAGASLVRDVLGVSPQAGGEHLRMGTHNLLLRLGEALYLEVISPNPAAPAPGRPRWFALDTMRADTAAALRAWVARTPDIYAAASACCETVGEIEPMSRGGLNWLITIPADGSLPLQGVAPALIQWQTETHPAAGLRDYGLSLVKLELFHPEPRRVARMLASLSIRELVCVSEAPPSSGPRLLAHINTPQGVRLL